MKNRRKSFTIIELLVVFAIFGLIASIIIVSTQSARDKARIAKSLQFSATIKHSLGADIVGEWRFEDGSASPSMDVVDSSGNNNNGTWKGTGTHWEENSIHELGWTGKFNGTNDYVSIPDSNSLDVQSGITIEAWIKPDSLGGDWDVVNKPSSYVLAFRGDKPQFNLPTVGPLLCPSNPFTERKWHHYVGTYNGSIEQIFVDGKEICSRSASGEIRRDLNPLFISVGFVTQFEGNIDEVRIYERGLTTAEIQKHYAEGAKKRGLLVKE